MVGQPGGCIRPVGRVELLAQCPVGSEQRRAEATRDSEVAPDARSDARQGAVQAMLDVELDARCDARQRAVQAIAARVLGELFGGASANGHSALPSLYALLDARLCACEPERGDLRALAPCSEVNLALGRLVAIIQGEYLAHTDVIWPKRELEYAVRLALVSRIQSEPRLRERAHRLRSCAGLAETAMEQHYSRVLLEQWQAQRIAYAPQPAGVLRTALLERCLVHFPYTRNYRLLTAAELRLLQQSAPPLLIRTAHCQSLSPARHQRLEAELAQLRKLAVCQTKRAHPPWHKQTIAVCGSGPLPVTGLMLHTMTGARVSLIERDASAANVSRALVEQLERLRVLDAGAVQVVEGDVATLVPSANIVVVASLVDHAAKLRLVEHLRAAGVDSGLSSLLLRSASSICAELAYEPVDTLMFSDPSLPFCGESVPATDRDQRTERLVSSAREVLNDTELYRPVQLSGAAPSTVSWLRDLLVQLRAAAR